LDPSDLQLYVIPKESPLICVQTVCTQKCIEEDDFTSF